MNEIIVRQVCLVRHATGFSAHSGGLLLANRNPTIIPVVSDLIFRHLESSALPVMLHKDVLRNLAGDIMN